MPTTGPAFAMTVERLQHAGMSFQQAVAAVTQQVSNQAYLLATVDFFRISAWVVVALIPLVWLTSRARAGGHAVAAD